MRSRFKAKGKSIGGICNGWRADSVKRFCSSSVFTESSESRALSQDSGWRGARWSYGRSLAAATCDLQAKSPQFRLMSKLGTNSGNRRESEISCHIPSKTCAFVTIPACQLGVLSLLSTLVGARVSWTGAGSKAGQLASTSRFSTISGVQTALGNPQMRHLYARPNSMSYVSSCASMDQAVEEAPEPYTLPNTTVRLLGAGINKPMRLCV